MVYDAPFDAERAVGGVLCGGHLCIRTLKAHDDGNLAQGLRAPAKGAPRSTLSANNEENGGTLREIEEV
eukprot:1181179-Prorocentrum_minimum.AAC.1